MQQRLHRHALQPGAAMQELELDQEECRARPRAEFLDQLDRRGRRAAGRQQVVDQHHPLARRQRVGEHFHGRFAVLQRVGNGVGLPGQLAGLAHRDETHAQLVGQRRAEDEAARVDADHLVHLLPVDCGDHTIDREIEQCWISENWSDVLENDAGLGKVGHVADRGA